MTLRNRIARIARPELSPTPHGASGREADGWSRPWPDESLRRSRRFPLPNTSRSIRHASPGPLLDSKADTAPTVSVEVCGGRPDSGARRQAACSVVPVAWAAVALG